MILLKRKKYRALSDELLLAAFKQKQSSLIIGEFYERYGHLVFGVSMKYMKNKFDAEDITMQVFESLPKKIAVHNIQNFKAWLYMVTKNECLMFLRKRGITSDLPAGLHNEDIIEQKEIKEEQLNLLETEIESLNEEQKICIKLFYIEQKSYQQIAELVKLDLKKVKSAIQNGKRNLKLKLEDRNEFKATT